MNKEKPNTKKQNKKLIEEATRRLAEIFIMQLEWKKNKKKKKKKDSV